MVNQILNYLKNEAPIIGQIKIIYFDREDYFLGKKLILKQS